jgi:hypothetical protein
LNVDCGCFGPEEIAGQQSLRQAFIRDLILIGAASFLYYTRRNAGRIRNRPAPIEPRINKRRPSV